MQIQSRTEREQANNGNGYRHPEREDRSIPRTPTPLDNHTKGRIALSIMNQGMDEQLSPMTSEQLTEFRQEIVAWQSENNHPEDIAELANAIGEFPRRLKQFFAELMLDALRRKEREKHL